MKWTILGCIVLLCPLVWGQASEWDHAICDGKQVIVHLFEWKWSDIAAECERFLAPSGYCAVQISPPQEHVLVPEDSYPWWERYQPVSYILNSRSGDEAAFTDMVQRCNAVGVRIIVDAVVNHMCGLGRSPPGSAGSDFNADNSDSLYFPSVPYDSSDFTPPSMCPSTSGNIDNYGDIDNVKNCYLVGLTDLYQANDDVRQKIAAYYNNVIDIGVMGFRVDASKHMWPDDLLAIQNLLNDLNTDQGFPAGSRPMFYHEVIDMGGEPITVDQYYDIGLPTEFRYGHKIKDAMYDYGQLSGLYDPGWNMALPSKAFVFVDNHDNQRSDSGVLTYKDGTIYQNAVVYTLAQDYGFTRVMSSYYFDNSDQSPPANGEVTDDVIINADGTCGGGWVCEHRWPSIARMAQFRTAVAGTSIANYYQQGSTVAFSRDAKGFFAMNSDGNFNQIFQTGMAAGTYCDLITSCAKSVTVGADGTATIVIDSTSDPYVAICTDCSGTPSTGGTVLPVSTVPPITGGTERTVVFIHKETQPGQDLFMRGGIGEDERPGCTADAETDICAIDITTNSLGTEEHYDGYNAWRVGDTKLDWYGAQVGQGTYLGDEASGSPLAWTTNVAGADGYQALNTYGEHYWMMDFDMDCSEAENGWFEVKAFLTNSGDGWETDIVQPSSCGGDSGGATPYASTNHLGKCGFVNVFEFDASICTITGF